MTARSLLAEAEAERDRSKAALERVLEHCDAADDLGMLIYPDDLRDTITRAYNPTLVQEATSHA